MTAHAEKGDITDPIIQNIVNNLKSVYDPEIPVNVYDLGLIYDITLTEKKCDILMTFTSPFCPVADYLYETVGDAGKVEGIDEVEVEVTFEPAWDMEMIPEATKLEMGLL
jgi:metal-sulfur cluster biosynthetic enzyme